MGTGTQTLEVTLTPPDSARLSNLCGVLDSNIARIESAFGVSIKRRGGHFRLSGRDGSPAPAAHALQQLYVRADRQIGPLDIQKELSGASADAEAEGEEFPVLPGKGSRRVSACTPNQRRYLRQMETSDVTLAIGPAGTGKTFLAVACALRALAQRRVERVVLSRPVVDAGEHLGFLPGDLEQKVDPYLRPLHDAIRDLAGQSRAEKHAGDGRIEIAPLAYMRGRTLNDSFVILDEGQNTTVEQMKMFLTRMGSGSRMVVTGDVTQVDLPPRQVSGLVDAGSRLAGIEGVSLVEFGLRDVVRHPVVRRVIEAYGTRGE